MKRLFIVVSVMLSLCGVANANNKTVSLHFKCQELLDLATYAEYFSKNLDLTEQQSQKFTIKSTISSDNVYSEVTLKLLGVDEEAFMKISWANYYQGQLVEKHSDQFSIERGVSLKKELEARYYRPLFRNSCILTLQ